MERSIDERSFFEIDISSIFKFFDRSIVEMLLSSKYNDLSFMFFDISIDERVLADNFNNSSFKFLEIFIDSILF